MSRDWNWATGWKTARYVLVALLVAGTLCANAHASTSPQKKALARKQFETAERMREALQGRPTSQRTIHDYKRVMEAYRKVYYLAPTSAKAPDSVVALAELLVEVGREKKSKASLTEGIGQYEFLLKEYPGSKQRVDALFTIAQVYQDDLGDAENAKATFEQFLKLYPHGEHADAAREALKQIAEETGQTRKSERAKALKPATEERSEPARVVEVTQPDTDKQEDEHHAISLVTGVRHWSTPDYTRIAIDLEEEIKFESGRIPNPDRIYFDLKDTKLSSVLKGKSFDVDDGYLKKIRLGQNSLETTRIVLEVLDDVSDYSAFMLPNPSRLIIDIHGKMPSKLYARTENLQDGSEKAAAAAITDKTVAADVTPTDTKLARRDGTEAASTTATGKKSVPVKIVEPEDTKPNIVAKADRNNRTETIDDPPIRMRGKKRQAPDTLRVHAAQPTADGDRSLIRALGLKIGRIVIDAGHGGHDTGTIGPNGLLEKDLVLDVALRLGKLLEDRLGAPVVYTRDDDTFIPLETRTAIANQQQADLFISVHANSSRDPSARGVETYYLNFTSSRDALEVAARENAVSETSIHELQDLVKKIALKEKIEESREFALDVQQSLHGGLSAKAPGIRDRGVKKAPFIVLIGANMPSILAEISFISNPTDEKRLKTPEYRQKIAESLYKGVSKYVGGLSGVKVASKGSKDLGQ